MSQNVISFHFSLRNTQGQLLDSSIGGQPVTYLEGVNQIIDGLEEAMRELAVGTKRAIMVSADKAYGQRDASLVQKVPRKRLPVEELKIGDMFQTGQDHHAPVVTVVAIEGEEVTLDANHPLAGQDLVFDIEVLNRRPAQADEISHGHVHGPGGHHHHH